jgi:hypothetical protein
MENVTETYKKSEASNNANETSHYVLMTVGIFVGFFGVVLRFLTDWDLVDIVSNIIFVIGIIICLKSVFNILK